MAIARLYNLDIVIHQTNQAVWTVSGPTSVRSGPARQLHIAYHDWEHYSSIRKLNDSSHDPALIHITLYSSAPAVTHAVKEDDIEIEIKEETEEVIKPEIVKPLTGKEKKRLRKQKAMERRAEKNQKEKDIPEIQTEQIETLPNLIQHLKI